MISILIYIYIFIYTYQWVLTKNGNVDSHFAREREVDQVCTTPSWSSCTGIHGASGHAFYPVKRHVHNAQFQHYSLQIGLTSCITQFAVGYVPICCKTLHVHFPMSKTHLLGSPRCSHIGAAEIHTLQHEIWVVHLSIVAA